MSICGNISPLLFLTFRNLYDISYSLLGFLVLVNFFTQLIVDLVFSFFSVSVSHSVVLFITSCLSVSFLKNSIPTEEKKRSHTAVTLPRPLPIAAVNPKKRNTGGTLGHILRNFHA